MPKRPLIAITTGDPDGIGLEVTLKALKKLPDSSKFKYLIFISGSAQIPKSFKKKYAVISSIRELPLESSLIFYRKTSSAFAWVEEAFDLATAHKVQAIVTGPLSKTLISKSGSKDLGHTEFFRSRLKNRHLTMCFLGEDFNVSLLTDHIPLKKAPLALKSSDVLICLKNTWDFAKMMGLSRRPLGLLGLNPHAGESGLLGKEEGVLEDAMKKARSLGVLVEGPLVPDAAFLKKNWSRFSFFVALYHDQGLIPFKMIHGQDSGAQLTLGLPFIRTSVDHGTAKDLFGKNLANPNSMIAAIKLAEKLVRKNAQRRNF